MFVQFDDDSQTDENVLFVLDFDQPKHGVQHVFQVLSQVVVRWQSVQNLQDGLLGLVCIVFDDVHGLRLDQILQKHLKRPIDEGGILWMIGECLVWRQANWKEMNAIK